MNICPHCHKEIKPKPRKKPLIEKWDILDVEYVLACDITNLIICNHPSLKKNLSTEHYRQKAAQAINDCVIKYGYSLDTTLGICMWVCSDPFWRNQLQAVPKLTRRDNGKTGIGMVWIDRFKLEMEKSRNGKSVESINEAFSFDGESK